MEKSALGAEGAPFVLDVERGKIHEFARATLSDHPAYFDGDNPVIPPTFLTTTFHWELLVAGSNPTFKLGLDLKRTLHAEQEYIFHGPPPRAGTRLHCVSKVTEIYDKEGRRGGTMSFAITVTEFRDEAGTLVAEAIQTAVETGQA